MDEQSADLCSICSAVSYSKEGVLLESEEPKGYSSHRALSVQLSTSTCRATRNHWRKFVTASMRQTRRDVSSSCSSASTTNTLTHDDYSYKQRTVGYRFLSRRLNTHRKPLHRHCRRAILDNTFTSSHTLATFCNRLEPPAEDLPGTARNLSAGLGYTSDATASH